MWSVQSTFLALAPRVCCVLLTFKAYVSRYNACYATHRPSTRLMRRYGLRTTFHGTSIISCCVGGFGVNLAWGGRVFWRDGLPRVSGSSGSVCARGSFVVLVATSLCI